MEMSSTCNTQTFSERIGLVRSVVGDGGGGWGELYGSPGEQSPRGGKIGGKMHTLNENICISALKKNC